MAELRWTELGLEKNQWGVLALLKDPNVKREGSVAQRRRGSFLFTSRCCMYILYVDDSKEPEPRVGLVLGL